MINNLPAVLVLLPLAARAGPGAVLAVLLGVNIGPNLTYAGSLAAAEHADLLILARDGDRTRLGPRSLGPATRFVVDHAPCPVLLVWPETAPGIATIPPTPPRPPHRPE